MRRLWRAPAWRAPFSAIRSDPLALLYFSLTLLFGLSLLGTLPPLQMPDEMTHFFKADAIAEGTFVAHPLGRENAGSDLPAPLTRFGWGYDLWRDRPPQPYSFDTLVEERTHDATHLRLTGPPLATGYPNTAIYPPFFYLPQAGALLTARVFGWGVLGGYFLARLSVLFFTALIGAWAIALMARGRLVLAMLLGLPMMLGLSVSCSQDAPLVACAALGLAILSVAEARGRSDLMFGGGVLMGLVISGKMAYAPLGLLPLFLFGADGFRRLLWARASASIIALGLAGLCGIVFSHPAKVPFLVGDHVDAPAQLRGVLYHPFHFAGVLLHTIVLLKGLFFRQFLGVLRQLDLYLPAQAYSVLTCGLALAILLGLWSTHVNLRASWREQAVRLGGIAACMAASIILIFLALYLVWTPLGHDGVEGIQGRYFIPVALAGALMLPLAPHEGAPPGRTTAETCLYGLFLIVGGLASQWAVIHAYWQV